MQHRHTLIRRCPRCVRVLAVCDHELIVSGEIVAKRHSYRIKRLGLGVSVIALVGAGHAAAQSTPPTCVPADDGVCVITNDGSSDTITLTPPARIVNRGTVSGVEGVVAIAPAPTTPGIPTIVASIIENRAGGTITGTGGTAIRGGGPLAIVNAGTINGNVQGAQYYVANGGTLNGNLVLGTGAASDFASSYFVQRGSATGVTGSINAGNGIDFWIRSYDASAEVTLGGALPTTFEVEGVEARGSGTTVTTNAASTTPVGGLMLMGDGNVVNRANIGTFNLNGANFPAGATLFTPAIGYAGIPETSRTLLIRFVNPFNSSQTVATYGVQVGAALTNFTNEAIVTGDLRLSTAGFVNTGTINLTSRATGSLIVTAADKDFTFRNTGTINYTDTGARAGQAMIESQYLNDYDAAAALRIYTVLSKDAKAATFDNSGSITGGLVGRIVAKSVNFTNTGTIAGIESTNATARGVSLHVGETVLDTESENRTVADSVAFLNDTNGRITNGVQIEAAARDLSFENRGVITGGRNNGAIGIDHYGANDANGNSIDTDRFGFANSGAITGDVVINTNALTSTVVNSGTITAPEQRAFEPFAFREAMEVEVETRGANRIDFTNSGAISQNNLGATGVSFEVESETGSTISIVNTGSIRSDAGAKRVAAQFAGQPDGKQLAIPSIGLKVVADTPQSSVRIENREGAIISANGLVANHSPTQTAPANPAIGGQAGLYSIAVLTNTGAGGVTEIVNAGTIQGGPSFLTPSQFRNYDAPIDPTNDAAGGAITGGASRDTVINTATGIILGGIALGAGDDRIENYGRIDGYVNLGTGNDTYLHLLKNGQFGTVDGGAGEDTLVFDITGSNGVVSDDLLSNFLNFEIRTLTGTGDVVSNAEVAVASGGSLALGAGSSINRPGETAVSGGDASETVSNAGTIVGNIALGGGDNRFANSGTVVGNMSAGSGADEFTNTGSFTGNVDLGAGGDRYVIGSVVDGVVDGGDGEDEIVFDLTARGGATDGAATATPASAVRLAVHSSNGAVVANSLGTDLLSNGTGSADMGRAVDGLGEAAATDPIVLNPAVLGNIANFELLTVNGPGTVVASGDLNVNLVGLNGASLVVAAGTGFGTNGATTIAGSSGVETVTIDGTLKGGVALGGGADVLNVSGRIGGAVDLGDGDDMLNVSTGASFGDRVAGGAGIDTLRVATTGTSASPFEIAGAGFTGFEALVNAGGVNAITGALNLGSNGTVAVDAGQLLTRNGATLTANVTVAAGAGFGNAGTLAGSVSFADGGNMFVNSGGVTGNVVMGGGADTLTNGGTILGTVATGAGADTVNANGRFVGAVDLGDGNDTLTIGTGALFAADVTGGAGTDAIVNAAGGSATAPFELAGTFTGFERYSQTAGVTAFSGVMSLGSGGSFAVDGGSLYGRALSVLTGNVTVASGATFGSAGTVNGNVTVASGATLAPGASPGVMTVNGNISLAGGSNTVFEFVPSPGQSDQLIVNGALTIANGATLTMTGNRPLTPGVTYNLITASGGINGTFGTVNKAATVLGFLRYTSNQLQLLGTFVVPTNAGRQTGQAVDYVNSVLIAGTASQSLLSAIPTLLNTDGTANTTLFAQLTPEAYASASQLSVEHGLTLARTARSGLVTTTGDEARPFTFAQGLGNWRTLNGNATLGTAESRTETYGIVGGVGYGSGTASVGTFVGKVDSDQDLIGRGVRTQADGMVAGIAGRFQSGVVDANVLVAYDWSKGDTNRAAPGGAIRGRYDLHALTFDAAVGATMPISTGWAIRPEAGVTHIATDRGGTVESGNATFGYRIAGGRPKATFIDGSFALKGGLDGAALQPWVQAGVRRQIDGRRIDATGGFAGAGSFAASGASREQAVGLAGVGLTARISARSSLYGAYLGEFGDTKRHNVTVGARFRF